MAQYDPGPSQGTAADGSLSLRFDKMGKVLEHTNLLHLQRKKSTAPTLDVWQ